jgi:site-specific DNA recombinase
MTKLAAIYARSSKDLHDVSCEAQEEQIRKAVRQNGEEVYKVFVDKALSSTRDVRPAFDEMISLATSNRPPFGKIYCLDTSRFGRDQHHTQALLWELRRKHGVEVVFTSMPHTGSYLDPAFEAIMSAFDYIHSQQSKVKGVASMKQNVLNGYRAGGRAPYGYRLRTIDLGKHRDGRSIGKTKLEPDPETAPIVREYFERRAKGETRKGILEDFFHRGIPSPTGREEWPVASAKAIEDNLEVYLGHTVFNRHNEKVKIRGKCDGYLHGKKWRPREEWVVKQNTHEALTSEEVAHRIREIKASGIRDTSFRVKRVYALSGLMKCASCGTNYTGDRGVYSCNSGAKPGERCHNQDISQEKVEEAVFGVIAHEVLQFKNVKGFIEQVKKRFQTDQSEIKTLEREVAQLDQRIKRVMMLYGLGTIDEREIQTEMQHLQHRKSNLSERLEEARAVQRGLEVSAEEILEVIEKFREEVRHADATTKKRVIQTLLEEIRIHPKNGNPWERIIEVRGIHIPLTRVNVASPTGFEPVLPT